MSENNTDITWTGVTYRYFLRDDQAKGICDEERYSLFREYPDYGRVLVITGSLEYAIREARIATSDDCDETLCFNDERDENDR
jgi:hypothetical protein